MLSYVGYLMNRNEYSGAARTVHGCIVVVARAAKGWPSEGSMCIVSSCSRQCQRCHQVLAVQVNFYHWSALIIAELLLFRGIRVKSRRIVSFDRFSLLLLPVSKPCVNINEHLALFSITSS